MPRRPLVHSEPLIVKLEPELKRRWKIRATLEESSMSELTRRVIEEYLARPPDEESGRGRRLVDSMRGQGRGRLSTDEIMRLTRGE